MNAVTDIGTDKVQARVEDGIGWIVFNAPEKHNAMGLEMSQGVQRVVKSYAENPEVRVVVLTGAGEKAFMSGADISEFEKNRSNAQQAEKYAESAGGVHSAIRNLPKPTIAMIRGYCMGGGLALAAACDLRFTADNGVFAIPAARLSIAYRIDFVSWVVELVGPSYAKDILYSARRLKADEALRIGLVNRVVPAAELEKNVREYCAALVENAPLSMRATKIIVGELLKDGSKRDEAMCERVSAECFDSADFKEGRQAFMEKRKPVWKGK
jgi:enoyl-CoA hydratase